ncbi:MAG: hypothetical protein H6537_08510 [Bacteroidales bacterium]|nr:hypothetical protein [Bacteroidales bacterium]HPD95065.1 hypothetical protein [Tenuifilaceae bacterium]HRX30380.1 hypothetical protein [Tenuifilaceae bacterium]
MNNEFICPKCGGGLTANGFVVFSAKNAKSEKGLILLSPHLGDYTKILNKSFRVEDGSKVKFYCPLCHADLTATEIHENLVHLILLDEGNNRHNVYFSGIVGEYCTYKISDDKYEKFGDASENYEMYFKSRRI